MEAHGSVDQHTTTCQLEVPTLAAPQHGHLSSLSRIENGFKNVGSPQRTDGPETNADQKCPTHCSPVCDRYPISRTWADLSPFEASYCGFDLLDIVVKTHASDL